MSPPVLSFRPDAGDVQVDLPGLLDTRALIQGSSRSGKTHALFALLEDTAGLVIRWVVDREADFIVLREKFDYVIVGGEGGDIPIELTAPHGFEVLVRSLLELRVNVIFDVSELIEEDRSEVVTRLCNELADLPRSSELWQSMLLLIDELQHYAPEGGKTPAAKAIARLGSLGGKRGFALIGATQALAEVSKSAIRMLENKVILRTGMVDAERAARELRMKGDIVTELRSFERGVGYAYGPAISLDPILIQFRAELEVYPPKRGEHRQPAPPAPDALRELLAKLPAAQAAAEGEIKSLEDAEARLKAANAEIARLKKAGGAPDPESVRREVDAAVARTRGDLLSEMERRQSVIDGLEADLKLTATYAQAILGVIDHPAVAVAIIDATPVRAPGKASEAPVKATPVPRERKQTAAVSDGLTPVQQRILDAIASMHSVRIATPSRKVVGALSGYSNTSGGSFVNNLSRLHVLGFVEYPSAGVVQLTTNGKKVANRPAKPLTLAALHEMWTSLVSPIQGRMLQTVIEAYPKPIAREKLGTVHGYTNLSGGSFVNNLSRLSSMGAVEYPSKGMVIASAAVFPEGLR